MAKGIRSVQREFFEHQLGDSLHRYVRSPPSPEILRAGICGAFGKTWSALRSGFCLRPVPRLRHSTVLRSCAHRLRGLARLFRPSRWGCAAEAGPAVRPAEKAAFSCRGCSRNLVATTQCLESRGKQTWIWISRTQTLQ
jgi:hypothetical protein